MKSNFNRLYISVKDFKYEENNFFKQKTIFKHGRRKSPLTVWLLQVQNSSRALERLVISLFFKFDSGCYQITQSSLVPAHCPNLVHWPSQLHVLSCIYQINIIST